MNLPIDACGPILGFLFASLSAGALKLAQSVPPTADLRNIMEGGAYIGLVTGLSYAVITLWKRLNKRDEDIAALNKEIRDDWKTQNDKLINVLEKLDPEGKG